ncbi:DotI/IcmL family type IV secretion protein [Legionella jamestowniensis]|uniref:IcmL-like protein n=1 Tax=Legionella jamestowniensis TaxID=455 RepID=A0A0W0UZR6_9GAMM|nr:DotI/IcmL family type IV secretion protein [Legionella jamestowniensis]KTD13361.1 IcmL-like protein [Legionella jamestowniensis]SFL76486.1 Macrophage killing protein with similarity to conjugation protein [Legionella jamestowniensis DSM 19215]
MNKSMLYAGLISILCTSVYAESPEQTRENLVAAIQDSMPMHDAVTETNTIQKQRLASQTVAPTSSGVQVPNPQGPEVPNPQGVPTPQNTPSPTQEPTPATDTSSSQGAVSTTQTQDSTSQTTTTTGNVVNTQPVPAATQTTTTTTTVTHPTPQNAQPGAVKTTDPLDCNYRIPPSVATVDQALVLKWAEKATVQSFDFDYNTMDSQLAALKLCYTDLGWQGFNDALQKSGNLNAIKSQQLMVSSMISGPGQITEVKENQWKISLPVQVVYQNNKEKLTQPLTVNLVVGRKVSGDLGIMQMIAMPRNVNAPATSPQVMPDSGTISPSTTTTVQPQ